MKMKYMLVAVFAIWLTAFLGQPTMAQMMNRSQKSDNTNTKATDSANTRGMSGSMMGNMMNSQSMDSSLTGRTSNQSGSMDRHLMMGSKTSPGMMSGNEFQTEEMMGVMDDVIQNDTAMLSSFDSLEANIQAMMKIKDKDKLKAELKKHFDMLLRTHKMFEADMSEHQVMMSLMRNYSKNNEVGMTDVGEEVPAEREKDE